MVISKEITSDQIISVVNNLNTTIKNSKDEVKKSAPSSNSTIVNPSDISFTSYKLIPSKLNAFILPTSSDWHQ